MSFRVNIDWKKVRIIFLSLLCMPLVSNLLQFFYNFGIIVGSLLRK